MVTGGDTVAKKAANEDKNNGEDEKGQALESELVREINRMKMVLSMREAESKSKRGSSAASVSGQSKVLA